MNEDFLFLVSFKVQRSESFFYVCILLLLLDMFNQKIKIIVSFCKLYWMTQLDSFNCWSRRRIFPSVGGFCAVFEFYSFHEMNFNRNSENSNRKKVKKISEIITYQFLNFPWIINEITRPQITQKMFSLIDHQIECVKSKYHSMKISLSRNMSRKKTQICNWWFKCVKNGYEAFKISN